MLDIDMYQNITKAFLFFMILIMTISYSSFDPNCSLYLPKIYKLKRLSYRHYKILIIIFMFLLQNFNEYGSSSCTKSLCKPLRKKTNFLCKLRFKK